VPYGESEREKLDIFGTDLPDESPIFVYFSGGYWQLLCGEMSAYVVEPMYHAKIVTIVVDYARAPGGN
jgi:arylformamidase